MMMEAKHTPGPWKSYVNETTDEGGMPVRATDPADGLTFRVADVYGIDQDADHCDISKANARLIAAAPELLAALIALRDAEWGDASDILARRKAADAAIAKATS